jgi:hypothetical protein
VRLAYILNQALGGKSNDLGSNVPATWFLTLLTIHSSTASGYIQIWSCLYYTDVVLK